MALKFLMMSVLLVAAFLAGTSVAYYLAKTDYEMRAQTPVPSVEKQIGVTASVGEKLQYSTTTENMSVRWVSDPIQVRTVLDEYWAQTGKLATGLSMTIGDKCVIYAFEPEYENDRNMQILGHEFTHCMRGTFHE